MSDMKNNHEEEIFDKPLQELFGNRYKDTSAIEPEYEQLEEPAEAEGRSGWKRVRAACGLIAGVGLLFYMIMTGKIDTAYGILFVSGVSTTCGYRLK